MTRLILLPGLDGTGDLFAPLLEHLPAEWATEIVQYPRDTPLDFEALVASAAAHAPRGEPWFILAESFSGPLGLRVASRSPAGLAGLILVATFVAPPMGGAARRALQVGSAVAARVPPLAGAVRRLMLDDEAPDSLVEAVQTAIRSVEPAVLASRLSMLTRIDARADLDDCPVPVLILEAKRDRLVERPGIPPRHPETVTQRSHAIDGPHLLLQTRPRQCADAIAGFIDSLVGCTS